MFPINPINFSLAKTSASNIRQVQNSYKKMGDMSFNNMFPLDLVTSTKYGGNFMVFYINEQDKSEYTQGTENRRVKRKVRLPNGEITTSNVPTVGRTALTGRRVNRTSKTTSAIALYIPNTLSVTTSTGYDIIDLDFVVGSLAREMTDSGLSNALMNFLGDAPNYFKDETSRKLFGLYAFSAGLQGLGDFLGSVPVLGNLGKIPEALQERAKSAILLGTGATFNPFKEVLFRTVEFRRFSFKYTLLPRNQKEMDQINRIINLFYFHMLPEERTEYSGRFWEFPSDFDIEFYKINFNNEKNVYENMFLMALSTCVLTNVAIDFVPGGEFVTRHDGSPVGVTLALDFVETEIMSKNRVAELYNMKYMNNNFIKPSEPIEFGGR